MPGIYEHVEYGSRMYADAFGSYGDVPVHYKHAVIDHMVKYVEGRVVRTVRTPRDGELYSRIVALESERRKTNDFLFVYSFVRREYDAAELDAAELFLLNIFNVFEPPGEQLGVIYLPDIDGPAESSNRLGPLVLECSRFRGESFCTSIAGEKVVAPALKTLIRRERFIGADFGHITCKGVESSKAGWSELIVRSKECGYLDRLERASTHLTMGPPMPAMAPTTLV